MNNNFRHHLARLWAPVAIRSNFQAHRWPIFGGRIPSARDFRIIRAWRRLSLASRYAHLNAIVRWAWSGDEDANFTYELTTKNKAYLAAFAAAVTGVSRDQAGAFIREAESDAALRAHIGKPFGRRLGWYALTRILKPRLVIETGVDQGVGSCVLCAALIRNADEGHPGQYVGTDINPSAGRLFTAPYAAAGRILYGDSLNSLRSLSPTDIGLFINDSDHSAEYERHEYEFVTNALSPRAIVIGDNAHATDELFRFAEKTGRRFLFFREEPLNHWYPGAGIGVAFPPTD